MNKTNSENMTFEIEHAKQRVLFKQWGVLNKANAIQSFRALYEVEGFNPSYDTLVDYREITTLDICIQDIKSIIAEVKDIEARTGKGALVVGENMSRRALAKLFFDLSNLFGKFKIRWKSFRTMEEAEQWLDSDD